MDITASAKAEFRGPVPIAEVQEFLNKVPDDATVTLRGHGGTDQRDPGYVSMTATWTI